MTNLATLSSWKFGAFIAVLTGAIVIQSAPSFAQVDLVSFGANWQYYDLGDEPLMQGAFNWTDSSFNDDTWSTGAAELGYGEGDEATVIGDTIITGYFRHEFTVADTSLIDNIDISLIFDDGAVVYLNGQEIWRVFMPDGPIAYDTLASETVGDNLLRRINIPGNLIEGINVLAVEVHQVNEASSDLSFDCEVVAFPEDFVRIIRGPYLQQLSDTTVTVKWRTSSPSESELRFGTSIDQLTDTLKDLNPKTDHEVEIVGLSPDQRYYYEIADTSKILVDTAPDLFFQTAPTMGTREPIRAWVLGNSGRANTDAQRVRDAYYSYTDSLETDMILFLGDNALQEGTDDEYQFAVFENMYEDKLKNTVSWSCFGNRDGESANSDNQTGPYYDIFTFPTQAEAGGVSSGTEAYYSFDYGNVHFISLNSYDVDLSPDSAMYVWCENDLQSVTTDWIVAMWHHAAYSKGNHDSDVETRQIKMRENFVPLLETYGVDIIFSAQSKSYERSYFLNGHHGNSNSFDENIHTVGANGFGDGRVAGDGAYIKALAQLEGFCQVLTGTASSAEPDSLNHEAIFLSSTEIGSSVMEVSGGELRIKFIDRNEVVRDSFTIIKDVGCGLGTTCDDGDICTVNDSINAQCQCVGTPIGNPPDILALDGTNAPLSQTYKANQLIQTTGDVFTLQDATTIFISPEVELNPTFEVVEQSEFQILQSGCE